MDSGLFLRISSHLLVTKGGYLVETHDGSYDQFYVRTVMLSIGRSYRKLIIIIFETKNIFKGLQA